jgi:hypothetical protein
VKYVPTRPFADPEAAARRLMEIANSVEPVQDGRIHIEKTNGPFLRGGGLPAEYGAGLKRAIERGWLWLRGERDICEVHADRRRAFRLKDSPIAMRTRPV